MKIENFEKVQFEGILNDHFKNCSNYRFNLLKLNFKNYNPADLQEEESNNFINSKIYNFNKPIINSFNFNKYMNLVNTIILKNKTKIEKDKLLLILNLLLKIKLKLDSYKLELKYINDDTKLKRLNKNSKLNSKLIKKLNEVIYSKPKSKPLIDVSENLVNNNNKTLLLENDSKLEMKLNKLDLVDRYIKEQVKNWNDYYSLPSFDHLTFKLTEHNEIKFNNSSNNEFKDLKDKNIKFNSYFDILNFKYTKFKNEPLNINYDTIYKRSKTTQELELEKNLNIFT